MSPAILLNVVLFKVVWVSAVVFAGGYQNDLLIIGALAAFTGHVYFTPTRMTDFVTGIFALCLGYLVDVLWVVFDILAYPNHTLVPYWIGVLWFALGMSMNHSFSLFRNLGWKGALIVGVFAPVTYLTGERFGAVQVLDLVGTVWISLSWVILFTLLTLFSNWMTLTELPRKLDSRANRNYI